MAEPTTTVWWLCAQHIVDLLRDHNTLRGKVAVEPGWPGDLNRKAEMVFIDELSSTEDRPVMTQGRQKRDEEFTLPLLVIVTEQRDLDATMSRLSEIVAAIQDTLAEAPTLTDLDGVLMSWVASKSM